MPASSLDALPAARPRAYTPVVKVLASTRPERLARPMASRVLMTVGIQPSTSRGLLVTMGRRSTWVVACDGVCVGQFGVGLGQAYRHPVAGHRSTAGIQGRDRYGFTLRAAHGGSVCRTGLSRE
jgi:hypothetical protein